MVSGSVKNVWLLIGAIVFAIIHIYDVPLSDLLADIHRIDQSNTAFLCFLTYKFHSLICGLQYLGTAEIVLETCSPVVFSIYHIAGYL